MMALLHRIVRTAVAATFMCTVIAGDVTRTCVAYAADVMLPTPTQLLPSAAARSYPMLKGLTVDPSDPLRLSFVIDTADAQGIDEENARTLVDYFLAAVALPQEDLWVNLSPYEQDRVVTDELAQTVLGETLLAQDYLLKQLSSSLTEPSTETGKAYWSAASHISNLKSENLKKIWIKPEKASVFEKGHQVFVSEATLDVASEDASNAALLPAIKKEVNESEHFAPIRQAYHSIILGLWFKQRLRDSIYASVIDRKDVRGVAPADAQSKDRVFAAYVESFRQGVYRQTAKVRENGRLTKKAYFSGGFEIGKDTKPVTTFSLPRFIGKAMTMVVLLGASAGAFAQTQDTVAVSGRDTAVVVDADAGPTISQEVDASMMRVADAMKNKNRLTRYNAASEAGGLGYLAKSLVPNLVWMVRSDTDSENRAAAAEALLKISHIPALKDAFGKEYAAVLQSYVVTGKPNAALHRASLAFAGESALPALIALVADHVDLKIAAIIGGIAAEADRLPPQLDTMVAAHIVSVKGFLTGMGSASEAQVLDEVRFLAALGVAGRSALPHLIAVAAGETYGVPGEKSYVRNRFVPGYVPMRELQIPLAMRIAAVDGIKNAQVRSDAVKDVLGYLADKGQPSLSVAALRATNALFHDADLMAESLDRDAHESVRAAAARIMRDDPSFTKRLLKLYGDAHVDVLKAYEIIAPTDEKKPIDWAAFDALGASRWRALGAVLVLTDFSSGAYDPTGRYAFVSDGWVMSLVNRAKASGDAKIFAKVMGKDYASIIDGYVLASQKNWAGLARFGAAAIPALRWVMGQGNSEDALAAVMTFKAVYTGSKVSDLDTRAVLMELNDLMAGRRTAVMKSVSDDLRAGAIHAAGAVIKVLSPKYIERAVALHTIVALSKSTRVSDKVFNTAKQVLSELRKGSSALTVADVFAALLPYEEKANAIAQAKIDRQVPSVTITDTEIAELLGYLALVAYVQDNDPIRIDTYLRLIKIFKNGAVHDKIGAIRSIFADGVTNSDAHPVVRKALVEYWSPVTIWTQKELGADAQALLDDVRAQAKAAWDVIPDDERTDLMRAVMSSSSVSSDLNGGVDLKGLSVASNKSSSIVFDLSKVPADPFADGLAFSVVSLSEVSSETLLASLR